MGLRLIYGASGSGKSKYLQEEMIRRSMEEPDRQFIYIVPDQFTMQTQKDLAEGHPNKGIMNIDVLSFGRLSYRILEETGKSSVPVLDDTGKNLLLRQVAVENRERLSVLGAYIDRQGYIHEAKSAISEFMQYGISVENMPQLIEKAGGHTMLRHKLEDLAILYDAFKKRIGQEYLTKETTMDLLAECVPQSAFCRDSVIVFDGFTGFTPIQEQVIRQLLLTAKQVSFSLTSDIAAEQKGEKGQQGGRSRALFALTEKTTGKLIRLAKEAGVPIEENIYMPAGCCPRFKDSPEMAHLEQNLFRYPYKTYAGENLRSIHLAEVTDPRREVQYVARQIRRLVREEGVCYRDIAVVSGDLASYSSQIKALFPEYDIPFYLDETRGIRLNPITEFIRSGLLILIRDFDPDSVFHFLKSGMTDISREDTQLLEVYVKAMGIRGRKKYEKPFMLLPSSMKASRKAKAGTDKAQKDATLLERLNATRTALLSHLSPLLSMGESAREKATALYDLLVSCKVQYKLEEYETRFRRQQDLAKAKEYDQIYRYVCDLLSQIAELLGETKVDTKEFAALLDAGFSEIKVGTIPASVDRIQIGDMERTRLKQVKILFLLGANDGNIPKKGGAGGILSDIDRECLSRAEVELSPTPREQMEIQRLYLYMNMTKPSQSLYISYVRTAANGSTMRPSYLIDVIKRLYPGLKMEFPDQEEELWQLESGREGTRLLADKLRRYAAGQLSEAEAENLFGLASFYGEEETLSALLDAAFISYEEHPLGQELARALYGKVLLHSVSRLENYASCAYAHFLKYGMRLQEAEEFTLENRDMGTLYHETLAAFSRRLKEEQESWFTIGEEKKAAYLEEAIEAVSASYGNGILMENATNRYQIARLRKILKRNVDVLQYQVQKGQFVPTYYEEDFGEEGESFDLGEGEQIRLLGRIDRIDTAGTDTREYIKVIDYKSGDKDLDLAQVNYDLQLQLVLYLHAALEKERKRHPDKEIVPGGLYYYHIADPFLKLEEELPEEERLQKEREAFRMKGVTNDSEEALLLIDRDTATKSDVVRVTRKKDGSLDAYSRVLSNDAFALICDYVEQRIPQIGREMLRGRIAMNPALYKTTDSCTWCPYKAICAFDEKIKGCEKRRLPELSQEEALKAMEEKLGEHHE
ncbi:MAG: exodeoxyribonuclease V subunit gamma [Lachnospiraceae bacterium]|nr:exodeoxyribonuclease V subunit gamma [Lachnospiraceae bacterium]